jgi:hypothetical protein
MHTDSSYFKLVKLSTKDLVDFNLTSALDVLDVFDIIGFGRRWAF